MSYLALSRTRPVAASDSVIFGVDSSPVFLSRNPSFVRQAAFYGSAGTLCDTARFRSFVQLVQTGLESLEGHFPIPGLRSPLRSRDDNSRGTMREADGCFRLVPLLSAGPGGTIGGQNRRPLERVAIRPITPGRRTQSHVSRATRRRRIGRLRMLFRGVISPFEAHRDSTADSGVTRCCIIS